MLNKMNLENHDLIRVMIHYFSKTIYDSICDLTIMVNKSSLMVLDTYCKLGHLNRVGIRTKDYRLFIHCQNKGYACC